MRSAPPLTAVAALLLPSIGWAADCAQPYTTEALLGDLVAIESALRGGDDATAAKSALGMEAGLGCMNEVLPRMIAGRALRAVGAGHVAGGNNDRGTRWLRTAAEIEQSFEFGLEDLPASHPVRMVYADAMSSSSGAENAVAGKAFAEGTAYLEGRKVTEPAARDDRFHVFQFENASGVRSWVIDGHDFPAEVLTVATVAVADAAVPAADAKPAKAPKPAKEPKVKGPKPEPEPAVADAAEPKPEKPPKEPKAAPVPKTGPDGKLVVERKRPWEKTPLMVGGGAVILGGAGVYYASYAKRQQFNDAGKLEDLDRLYPATNQLYFASLAILATGVGTFTWGVILDASGPLPSITARF